MDWSKAGTSVRFDPPKTHASGCSLPGARVVNLWRGPGGPFPGPRWDLLSEILVWRSSMTSLFRDKSDLFSIPGVLDICQAGDLVTGRSGRDRSGQIVDLYRVPAFLTHPNRIEGPTVRCGWLSSNHAVFEFTNQNLRQPILVADFAIYANGNPGEVPGPKEWMCGFEDFGDETTFF